MATLESKLVHRDAMERGGKDIAPSRRVRRMAERLMLPKHQRRQKPRVR